MPNCPMCGKELTEKSGGSWICLCGEEIPEGFESSGYQSKCGHGP